MKPLRSESILIETCIVSPSWVMIGLYRMGSKWINHDKT
jgi:hypothetical protein